VNKSPHSSKDKVIDLIRFVIFFQLAIVGATIFGLAAQVGAAVWWGAQIDAKVKLVEENRRYIQEVVIPSYEISDSWDNPHYNNWLKAGGWKDK